MKKIISILFFLIFLFFLSILSISFPVKSAAPVGNFLEMNGGYLRAASSLTGTPSAFSFEAWVKPEHISGVQKILSIGDKSNSKFRYEVGLNGNSLQLSYHYNNYSSQKIITAGFVEAGIWNHVAIAISSSATNLYVNGKKVAGTSGASPLFPVASSIILGKSYQESFIGTEDFAGAIDEVRISTGFRDASSLWTAGVYNHSLTVDSETLLLWRLDEGRGQTVAGDASGNGFSGSLVGGDSKIHFYGTTPTPTPFALTPINWVRPVLPTLSFPFPTVVIPTPDSLYDFLFPTPRADFHDLPRPIRTILR